MSWTNVNLIFRRELRDQLRDRRTLFTLLVLPLLLYPLLGMTFLQVAQFLREHPSRVWVIGAERLGDELLAADEVRAEFCSPEEQRLLALERIDGPAGSEAELRAFAEQAIEAGQCDAVVHIPPGFPAELARFRALLGQRQGTAPPVAEEAELPQPQVYISRASDKSRIAHDRVETVLRRWREALVEQNLERHAIPVAATRPFEVQSTDVSQETRRRAHVWSKVLPFVLLVWALTGAFYPAIDLCAGEKERGTLETLLTSPAGRSEIVWGKLLTVMAFSIGASGLNLLSMTFTGAFIIGQLPRLGAAPAQLEIGAPPLLALVWLAAALVPISALFSALSLAIAAFARSSKEGQYYLMPLLMVTLPLIVLPLLPAADLDLGSSLIPVSGVMLILRTLIEGQYLEALRYFVPVTIVTGGCCLLAIRWAVDQFNNESVLFRESERFGLGLWLRRLVRDRGDAPTVGEALLCGMLLLVIRFFASLAVAAPQSWPDFVSTHVVTQVALIATPACLMAIILTRRPGQTLLLGRPSFWITVPAAALLAATLHPAWQWLAEGIQRLYPLGDDVARQLAPLSRLLADAPLPSVLLLIALLPAVCEELAFRGFILSGLRRMGHKWGAIALASALFGLTHGILQQSLSAFAVGLVLGYVAVKTGSLWPAVAYHATHNGLSIWLSRLDETVLAQPWIRLLFAPAGDGQHVGYAWSASLLLGAAAGLLLLWFKRLPYRATDEERLVEALDRQPLRAPESVAWPAS